jgi:hypothetical protein
MDERCETCRFWDTSVQHRDAQADTTGICRAGLPVADDRDSKARWPFTEDVDWCGKHEPSPIPEPDIQF